MKLLSLLLFGGFSSFLLGQNQLPVGARSAGMGNASVCLPDIYASFNNQAGLGFLNEAEAALVYENRYISSEINKMAVAVAVPIQKVGTFGVNVVRFGYAAYNENKFGIAYSRAFGEKISIGVQFNFMWLHIGDVYGNRYTGTGEISFLAKPLKNWWIGAHVYNLTRTPLADYQREKLNTIFKLGSAYHLKEKLIISAELEASLDYKPTFRFGFEYLPIKILFIRAGFNVYPIAPSLGAGILIKKLQLDFASSWQPVLGFCPQISMRYAFGAIKKKTP